MKQIENFFSDDLYKECIDTAKYLLSLPNNVFCTNYWWQDNVVKDSFPVLVHVIDRKSELSKKIEQVIQNKTELVLNDERNLMFYYWTRFSYIPWHNDSHCDAGLTVYLNDRWEPDFGGYFIYKHDENDLRAITPKPNLGLLQKGGTMHTTTPVNFTGKMRITLQCFLSKK